MVKILIGIIIGYIIHHYTRRLFLKWQLRELKRMAGILSSEEGFYGTPGKWGKRFKYLHNFVVETRGQFLLQCGNLKKDLLKLCLKFNILNFKATPLGKCLQAAIDAETKVFGDSLILFHESPLLQLKYYFYRLAHPQAGQWEQPPSFYQRFPAFRADTGCIWHDG